jgi:DNA-directed RNA polymerase specialized sigma24 family protein
MVLAWVNTIALNLYRREPRMDRFRIEPETAGRYTTINWAAIDLARLLDSCARRDRLLLEAQLAGVTAQEFARKHGATQTAIRSRFLRARQAARRIAGEIRWDLGRLPRVA